MSAFLNAFDLEITRRALLACVLIGFANGFLSGFVVLKKSALKLGTISHGLLPGIALAVTFFGLASWSVLAGALVAALLIGLGSLFVARTTRVDQDTALAVLYTAGFGGGLILISRLGIRQKLDEWLFGGLMGMSHSDLWIAFGISAIAVLSLTALQRPMLILLFEPNIAASLGIPVRALNYTLLAIVILVLVSSLQAVGCILSVGLLVAPAATLFMFFDSAPVLFWGGGLLGAAGSCAALVVSYELNWPVGGTIACLLGGLFALAFVLSPKYGLLRPRRT
jgi:manganese/iron transport system permease protein/iron/zinc/copper transport system permease protein